MAQEKKIKLVASESFIHSPVQKNCVSKLEIYCDAFGIKSNDVCLSPGTISGDESPIQNSALSYLKIQPLHLVNERKFDFASLESKNATTPIRRGFDSDDDSD